MPKESNMAVGLKSGKYSKYQREDLYQFRVIYVAAFGVFLLPAIISLFLPRKWRLLPETPGAKWSFIGQAKAAANTAATYALMGF
jgi:hypothetical protein